MLGRLPHRDPFLFVSSVSDYIPGERARGVWSVTGDEAFFAGHFPGEPIVPGVLISEALAQLAGLVVESADDDARGRLAHVNVKFAASVRPPAEISLAASLARSHGALSLFDVEASCDDVVVASGALSLAIGGAT